MPDSRFALRGPSKEGTLSSSERTARQTASLGGPFPREFNSISTDRRWSRSSRKGSFQKSLPLSRQMVSQPIQHGQMSAARISFHLEDQKRKQSSLGGSFPESVRLCLDGSSRGRIISKRIPSSRLITKEKGTHLAWRHGFSLLDA